MRTFKCLDQAGIIPPVWNPAGGRVCTLNRGVLHPIPLATVGPEARHHPMPKIITAKRLESEAEKAREYVKTHILFPSGLLGLIFMISGMASLGYQFLAETYSWHTFLESSMLLVMGGLLGWSQTRYHRFLLREFPEHFASRMRTFSRRSRSKPKREAPAPSLDHRGRALVPFSYLAGLLLLLGSSALAAMAGHVYYVAAFLLPWAGFFWAKLFFWRGVLVHPGASRR